jgi:dolichol-phosphate mannosyltransferase
MRVTQRSLVVVPTLNEAGNIDPLLTHLLVEGETDVLIIDDGSTDGTQERLAAWLARYPARLQVMQRGQRMGLGTAHVAGFRHALTHGYTRMVQMDADLSHDPRVVPKLLAALDRADLAIGSRYVRGGRTENWSFRRAVVSWTAVQISRTLTGVPVRDITSGFRAFRAETLAAIEPETLHARGFSIQVETSARAHRAGLRVVEVPIIFHDRRAGSSKMDLSVLLEWGRTVWRVRRPLSLAKAQRGKGAKRGSGQSAAEAVADAPSGPAGIGSREQT